MSSLSAGRHSPTVKGSFVDVWEDEVCDSFSTSMPCPTTDGTHCFSTPLSSFFQFTATFTLTPLCVESQGPSFTPTLHGNHKRHPYEEAPSQQDSCVEEEGSRPSHRGCVMRRGKAFPRPCHMVSLSTFLKKWNVQMGRRLSIRVSKVIPCKHEDPRYSHSTHGKATCVGLSL